MRILNLLSAGHCAMENHVITATYPGESMIRIKDHKQQQLFDPWRHLSPKRRRMLDEDWPGLFREHLLEELPVDQMLPHFSDGIGRPCKELYTVLGLLLLQQTMDLTDKAAIEQLAFNIQWHYALNLPEESDDAKTISEKTLYTMRQVIIDNHLDETMFDAIADKLAVVFGVDTKDQRIDSVHIRSNMRKLGRIGIFSRTIFKFLVNLKRHHRPLFDAIDENVIGHYWGKKALAAFAMVKPSQSEKTLQTVSADLFDLIEQFKDQPKVCAMHSYKLMQRVLAEQCNLGRGTGKRKVTVKKPAEIPSDSLQNPSDPDATYSGHKGQGYQVQVMETFSRCEDQKEKQQQLNLITHVDVQTACEHDVHALAPAIADTKVRGVAPDKLMADTLYGSDDNDRIAKLAKVELVAPPQKGRGKQDLLSQFSFDASGLVTRCPAGHRPDNTSPKTRRSNYGAGFDLQRCLACPLRSQCPVKPGRKKAYLRYSEKRYRLANRRALESSEAFIDDYRWRAGVEATMSEFDRRTGVKKLRIRGMPAVRFCARMKATGLNILRAGAVRKARIKALRANGASIGLVDTFFHAFKERILRLTAELGTIFLNPTQAADNYQKMAA